jgi:hypothetical protein
MILTVESKAQANLYQSDPFQDRMNLTELLNTGINLVDPVLPDSLKHNSSLTDEILRQVKDGADAAGWSQNHASPYYLLVSVSEKSTSSAVQIYAVQVDWGFDQIPVVTNASGMNGDESFAKTVVITNSNYTPVISAVRELSRKAAMKLQMEILRKVNNPLVRPNTQLDNLY